jgi:hypothetical protein
MSDKLVVEFYCSEDSVQPVACVLACHGGDNPSSAATTLADFFDKLALLPESRFDDAALLAARFIVWESSKGAGSNPLDFCDVALHTFRESAGYQIARVYARGDRPYVHCVRDEWSSEQELIEAALILRQPNVDPLETSLSV